MVMECITRKFLFVILVAYCVVIIKVTYHLKGKQITSNTILTSALNKTKNFNNTKSNLLERKKRLPQALIIGSSKCGNKNFRIFENYLKHCLLKRNWGINRIYKHSSFHLFKWTKRSSLF